MDELYFSNNFSDRSVESGENAGFQFDFNCQHCQDTWRSPFIPFQGEQTSSWIRRASGVAGSLFNKMGGMLNQVGDVAEGLAKAGYGKAHDAALAQSIEKAKAHFNRCAKCNEHVCIKCWNTSKGLCLSCAPDIHSAVESARDSAETEAAVELAREEGATRGQSQDVKTNYQLICPKCNAQTKGGKFCPECGAQLNINLTCHGCGQVIPPGSKFCPSCGAKE